MDHQVDWWEEGILAERLSPIREGYEAQFPMVTFARPPMGGKGGLGSGHGRAPKAKAFRPPNRPHKSSKFFKI